MSFCKRKGVECEYKTLCDIHQDSVTVDSCQKNLYDILTFNFTPDLNSVTEVVDTETDGKKFAIGTKNHADTFVLNFKDSSCLLFMGDIQPIDLRKFNFDEFTSIEINGNKFVREV